MAQADKPTYRLADKQAKRLSHLTICYLLQLRDHPVQVRGVTPEPNPASMTATVQGKHACYPFKQF